MLEEVESTEQLPASVAAVIDITAAAVVGCAPFCSVCSVSVVASVAVAVAAAASVDVAIVAVVAEQEQQFSTEQQPRNNQGDCPLRSAFHAGLWYGPPHAS